MNQTWGDIIINSFQKTFTGLIAALPEIIGAILVFLIGLLIAVTLAKIIEKICLALKIDLLVERVGIKGYFERSGITFNFTKFLSELVKWFLIIVFLIAAADIVNLSEIVLFLKSILSYIPRIIISIIIIIAAILITNFTSRLIKNSIKMARLKHGEFLDKIMKCTIYIFTSLVVLDELGITPALIRILFIGIVAMAAIAGGIAFGLGGKEAAKDLLDKLIK